MDSSSPKSQPNNGNRQGKEQPISSTPAAEKGGLPIFIIILVVVFVIGLIALGIFVVFYLYKKGKIFKKKDKSTPKPAVSQRPTTARTLSSAPTTSSKMVNSGKRKPPRSDESSARDLSISDQTPSAEPQKNDRKEKNSKEKVGKDAKKTLSPTEEDETTTGETTNSETKKNIKKAKSSCKANAATNKPKKSREDIASITGSTSNESPSSVTSSRPNKEPLSITGTEETPKLSCRKRSLSLEEVPDKGKSFAVCLASYDGGDYRRTPMDDSDFSFDISTTL